jgi:glycine/D-amino acid oxidase-like deaminating enzyme
MAGLDGKRPHYLIIGAGVAGCSVVYELSKHDVQVTVIDAGPIGSLGASAVPVALLNPHRGRTARASELDKAGLAAMWEVVKELEQLGLEHGVRQRDILRIASSEKQAKLWQKLEGIQWLGTDDIPKGFHAPFGGMLVKGGWLEPRKFLNALVVAAKQRNVMVLESQRVNRIKKDPSSRFQVSVDHVNSSLKSEVQNLTTDVVILCTGVKTIEGLAFPGLEHFTGDVVTFESDVTLPYPIAGAIYGLQHNNQVLIGGNHREELDDPSAVQQLQKSSSWFIPALKEAYVLSKWTGTRARQEDNQPLFAEIEPNLIFFGALSGRGFLCSSYLAKTLVESLLGL